ncbi:hypothetical protein WM40_11435 [Robbsia andropogonis]|uniref:Uncharacterized protein n=1 Tax=Robbsia andropogonis TaxID=28092 RepID=A0A0F5K152_9BURK|nr:hypothetical protein WM40_11435 [Robbsia andropogonis]
MQGDVRYRRLVVGVKWFHVDARCLPVPGFDKQHEVTYKAPGRVPWQHDCQVTLTELEKHGHAYRSHPTRKG